MTAMRQPSISVAAPIFERILCVTGKNDRDTEAVRQAAVLARISARVARNASCSVLVVRPPQTTHEPIPASVAGQRSSPFSRPLQSTGSKAETVASKNGL